MKHVIIGSRGSDLALQQANQVKDMLKITYPKLIIQIHTIRTQGDYNLEKSIEDLGGKVIFKDNSLINAEFVGNTEDLDRTITVLSKFNPLEVVRTGLSGISSTSRTLTI